MLSVSIDKPPCYFDRFNPIKSLKEMKFFSNPTCMMQRLCAAYVPPL
jgi:hypothetical protein